MQSYKMLQFNKRFEDTKVFYSTYCKKLDFYMKKFDELGKLLEEKSSDKDQDKEQSKNQEKFYYSYFQDMAKILDYMKICMQENARYKNDYMQAINMIESHFTSPNPPKFDEADACVFMSTFENLFVTQDLKFEFFYHAFNMFKNGFDAYSGTSGELEKLVNEESELVDALYQDHYHNLVHQKILCDLLTPEASKICPFVAVEKPKPSEEEEIKK